MIVRISMDKKECLIEIVKDILQLDECYMAMERLDIETWDSLAHVMLISEIETRFQTLIPFEDINKIEKVEDFLKYIVK
jgi:acyl carrier protein